MLQVRNILGIPVPQIYGYSASTDNPVKAEYILMERSAGVELSKVWGNMSGEQRDEVLTALVSYEIALSSAGLPMYGSLYYTEDLSGSTSSQILDSVNSVDKRKRFAVGPTTNRAFFDNRRDAVETDLGPCTFYRFVIMLVNG